MKVSDLQKCLRAIAEVISTKAPAGELTEAADALAPFARRSMGEFAAFLRLAEEKYGETGELPDGRPPKPLPMSRVKKPSAVEGSTPTVEGLLAVVAALKVQIRTDQSLTKDKIAVELSGFEKLNKADLLSGVLRLGMKAKPKTMAEALAMIVNHTVSAQAGVERSDA